MECFVLYAEQLKRKSLSPSFFVFQPKNTNGFVELNRIAVIDPPRKLHGLKLTDLVPYVGLPETDDLEIKAIRKRLYREVKGRKLIKKGDILFARIEPSIFNKKYIFVDNLQGNKYAFTSTEFYIVRPKKNINPKFLFYAFFTKEVFSQILGRTTGSTGRRRLDRGVFKNLLIPYPDRLTQNRIVQIMDNAYSIKKSKEDEAQRLLDSINDYVLSELGIKMPKLKDKMTFSVYSNDIKGKRLGPYYYQPKFEEVEKAIKRGKYEVRKLKNFISCLSMGISVPNYKNESKEVPFILGKNLKIGYLDLTDLEHISKKISEKHKSSILKENDVLFSVRGAYIGKTAVVPKELEGANIINNIVKISLNRDLNPNYLVAYLSSKIEQKLIYRSVWGGAQPGFTNENIRNLKIPLPPLDIQNKIAEEVKSRMEKAKQLQEEAKETLEKAKQKVEKIILGEEDV